MYSKYHIFFQLPKEAIHYNVTCQVIKILSNFLIQLEVQEGGDPAMFGKKLFASRNRFYTQEGVVMKPKMTFENFVLPGAKIHCDISPQTFDQDSWVATLAWVGGLECKPDIDAVHWHHELNRCELLLFLVTSKV